MSILKLDTPGVYVQEIPSLPPSIAEVQTAIPAFIGYTETAETDASSQVIPKAQKINNFAEFESYFGGPPKEKIGGITYKDLGGGQYDLTINWGDLKRSKYILYYSVKHFYDNGGGTCYVVSVDKFKDSGSIDQAKLLAGLTLIADIDEVTLLVIPEATKIDTISADNPNTPEDESLDTAAYKAIVNAMILQAYQLKDRFAIIDPIQVTHKTAAKPGGDLDKDALLIRNATAGVAENSYAAAYYPNLVSTYNYNFDYSGLKAKKEGDASEKDVAAGSVLYNKIEELLRKELVLLPPSGAIAGLYARVDQNKGVWKAPANESLIATLKPEVNLSDREQGGLNIDVNSGKSINVIRSFPGFGTLVWGARTLNGNDNEWKYINIRRFFNMVEESIKKSSQWAVFEPNTVSTWVKMQAMIENYLFLKWREGALAGNKPEQAYYARVGLGTTMTSVDILEGRMNVEIGMAVARPAEFIVLKFIQMMQEPA